MRANFTPTFQGYSGQKTMQFWCQTVLPLVYDDALSYYEVLDKVVDYLNNIVEDLRALSEAVERLEGNS